MNKLLTLFLALCLSTSLAAQSRSVEDFRQDYKPSLKLFFYQSTLKMYSRMQESMQEKFGMAEMGDLSQIPQLGEMINGIEKVKFFNYEDWTTEEDLELFAQLEKDVQDEGYESLMTARMDGNQLNVMIKERRDQIQGFVVIIQMEDGFSIIDIEGYPDVNKILELSQFINQGSENMNLSGVLDR